MKHIRKIAALVLFFGLVAGLFGTVRVAAEDKTPAAPKITVKTFSKKTGVKITIKKNANAEAYEVTISGTPANSDACSMFKYKAKDGNVYMGTSYTIPVYQDGKVRIKGDMEEYITEQYSIAGSSKLMLEVNSAGGAFCVSWMQRFGNEKYLKTFRSLLESNGISCEVSGPFPITDPRWQIG